LFAFWLEAGSENRRVRWIREAIAHVRGTFIFDVHVEFANARRKQEVHDGAIIRKLSSRQHYLIWALRVEFLQPSTSFIRGHDLPLMPSRLKQNEGSLSVLLSQARSADGVKKTLTLSGAAAGADRLFTQGGSMASPSISYHRSGKFNTLGGQQACSAAPENGACRARARSSLGREILPHNEQ
jgi:hypothetical protein